MSEPRDKPEEPPEEEAPLELAPLEPEPRDPEPPASSDPAPLELAPLEEEPPRPIPPPRHDETPPGAGVPPPEARGEETEDESQALSLHPSAVGRILAWPAQGRNAFAFWTAYVTLFVALSLLFLVGMIPFFGFPLGTVLRSVLSVSLASWFVAYLPEAIRAVIRGDGAPTLDFGTDRTRDRIGEGARVLVILCAYAAFPTAVGFANGSAWWAYPFAVAAWYPVPAAILLFATSGSLLRANPVTATRLAIAGGREYVLITVPGALMIGTRFAAFGWPGQPLVEASVWLVLVYTSILTALLALEKEAFLARIPELLERREEDPEESDEPEEDVSPDPKGNG